MKVFVFTFQWFYAILSLKVAKGGENMITFIAIVLLLFFIFGGKSENSGNSFDEDDEFLETLYYMDMMDNNK